MCRAMHASSRVADVLLEQLSLTEGRCTTGDSEIRRRKPGIDRAAYNAELPFRDAVYADRSRTLLGTFGQ